MAGEIMKMLNIFLKITRKNLENYGQSNHDSKVGLDPITRTYVFFNFLINFLHYFYTIKLY